MSKRQRFDELLLRGHRLAPALLFFMLGWFQVSSVAHDFQHAIADIADRCATCVHTEQLESCAAADMPQPAVAADSKRRPKPVPPLINESPFRLSHARAPPLA